MLLTVIDKSMYYTGHFLTVSYAILHGMIFLLSNNCTKCMVKD